MKRIFYLFAAFVSSATALSAATDDIYSQCISAKFDSPADAQKSAAEILPYPDGRKIAFSTRWDDTNPRHLATAQMLSKRGMFATCYLVGYGFQNPETLAMVQIQVAAICGDLDYFANLDWKNVDGGGLFAAAHFAKKMLVAADDVERAAAVCAEYKRALILNGAATDSPTLAEIKTAEMFLNEAILNKQIRSK